MAKTLEQLTQETLGQLHWAVIQLRAQVETLQAEIIELKANQNVQSNST